MFVLLTTWLGASNHCCLETARILPSDTCHTDGKSSASGNDPCENGCKITEKAGSKLENGAVSAVVVAFLTSQVEPELENLIVPNQLAKISAWPPEALHLPQFLTRTSLPVRAPSFAS